MQSFVLACIVTLAQGYHFHDDEPCNNSLVIAFTSLPKIVRWDLEADEATAFTPTTFLQNPIAIAADQRAGVVFFTDVQLKIIMRKDFKNETNSYMIRQLSSESVPDGIAVDPLAHKVYYTDFAEKLIARMNYDGTNHQILMTSDDKLDQPRAIILDTQTSTMYYTDWGSDPHISKADFTGNNMVVLQNTSLLFPNGLTADFTSNKIYWCDAGLDTISVMDTDGSNRATLFSTAAFQNPHFFDITLYHDYLFVTDWTYRTIFRLDKNGGTQLESVASSETGRPNGLAQVCIAHATSAPLVTLPRDSSTSSSIQSTTTTTTTSTTTPTTTTTSTTTTTTPTTTTTTTSTTTPTTTTTSTTTPTTPTTTVTTSPTTPTSVPETTKKPQAEPRTNESNNGELSTTTVIIIAMAIGGTLLLAVIVTVSVCCCVRMANNKSRNAKHVDGSFNTPGQPASLPPPYPVNPHTQYETVQYVGKGGFDNPNIMLDNGDYLHPPPRQAPPRDNNENIYMSIFVKDDE